MAGYSPLKITGNSTGLVQERENFLLPDDAYPVLQNAYVWRERILRKRGFRLLGRLQRNLTTQSLGNTIATGVQFNLFTQINLSGSITNITQANPGSVTTSAPHLLQTGQFVTISGVVGMTQVNNKTYQITVTGGSTFTIGIDTTTFTAYSSGGTWVTNDLSGQTLKTIVPGSVIITMPGPIVFTDQGNGTLTSPTMGNSGIINYSTGNITLTTTAGAGISTVTFSYYPDLPVMGIRIRELQNSAADQTIFFDQVYAYIFNSSSNQFQEFIPGTTWNKHGGDVSATDFFWSTNYWVSSNPPFTTDNRKLFWVTNNTGQFGANADPPKITDGTTWILFYDDTTQTNTPWALIDGTNYLTNWLCNLPFRGRMVTFNTWEGPTAASSIQFSNRIRWATIGNPFIPYAAGPPATGSWRDDIRGQGGFLDIPTSEDIVSVGFVRDNLVIYCERSTWQLRYTGRSIAPFQIEKVNSELGVESTFSAVQFDTSLVGIGDKGIVECDSYKSERIDIKIPDFVFSFTTKNNGVSRVQGIRDFPNRLAYWTVPIEAQYDVKINPNYIFPNTRLVYNYENDSWATFSDTLTALGNYQAQSSRNWINTKIPWVECNFPWRGQTQGDPQILGGNQQGFVEILNDQTVNDISLFISNITGGQPIVITSPNHNLTSFNSNENGIAGSVIQIRGIPNGTAFADLNGGIFGVLVVDANNFQLWIYNPADNQFSIATNESPMTGYVGGGLINIRENFTIQSKKFNFLDEGQNIQIGYLDILLASTEASQPGAISLNIYLDYDDDTITNIPPQNVLDNDSSPPIPDTFFNNIIPTIKSSLNNVGGTKFWQRVFCATRANFITLEYTFNNAQLVGEEQVQPVQIDAQILWLRKAGRLTQI